MGAALAAKSAAKAAPTIARARAIVAAGQETITTLIGQLIYSVKRTPIQPPLGAPGDTNRPSLKSEPNTPDAFP